MYVMYVCRTPGYFSYTLKDGYLQANDVLFEKLAHVSPEVVGGGGGGKGVNAFFFFLRHARYCGQISHDRFL